MTSLPHAISPDLAEVDPDFLRDVMKDDAPFFDEAPSLPESAYWEPDEADAAWHAGGNTGGCGPEELGPEDLAMLGGTAPAGAWWREHGQPEPGDAPPPYCLY
jgi:hypothetical protein